MQYLVRKLGRTPLAGGAFALAMSALAVPATAATLSGTITSAQEGAMEGVVITARKDGSTITTGVVSNEKGVYTFPDGRLEPGKYTIAIRAIGFDLEGPKTVEIGTANATANVKLVPTKDLAAQLTNAEWMVSMPKPAQAMGGEDMIKTFYSCASCHTVERIVRSSHDMKGFLDLFPRMSQHASQSFDGLIQMRKFTRDIGRMVAAPAPGAERQLGESGAPLSELDKLAIWLADTNLSKRDKWNYDLKKFPRPSGRGTKVIYTEYDLPRKSMQPHDVILDHDGGVWFSNFGENSIGKVDPKTGKVTEYKYEPTRPGFPNGNLDIEVDYAGDLWIGRMNQTGVARFHRDTGKFEEFPVPEEMRNNGTQQAMVAPYAWQVDNKVWMNDAENRTFTRVDIKTGKYEPFWEPYKTRPQGERNSVYGMYSDSQNNGVFCNFSNGYIGIANAKTGGVTLYPTPTPYSRPRRGRVVNDVFWYAQYRTDKLGMFDLKTKEMKEWDLPIKYASPYDVVPDKNGDLWTGNDQDDRITRLDPKTGKSVQYLMPHEVNVRRVFVDNKTARPTFWVGSNHTASIYKLEPLD